MSTQITSYHEIVSQLPEDAAVTFHDVSWDEYEGLLEQRGEAPGLRITYDNGSLHAVTISPEHEKYSEFVKSLIAGVRLRLQINILAFGSATMRKPKRSAGHEPDACLYVQTAPLIGAKIQLDFGTDPSPDIVVEIDVHHDSRPKFRVYAALGGPEIWRYERQSDDDLSSVRTGRRMAIYRGRNECSVANANRNATDRDARANAQRRRVECAIGFRRVAAIPKMKLVEERSRLGERPLRAFPVFREPPRRQTRTA